MFQELNNFSGVMQVLSCIGSAAINRLQHTFAVSQFVKTRYVSKSGDTFSLMLFNMISITVGTLGEKEGSN